MGNDRITALNNALSDITKERLKQEEEIGNCQHAVDRAQVALRAVQERAKCADYERRAVERDLEALRSLYNSSAEKPQVVLLRIEKLQKDHSSAFGKSQIANRAVQEHEQILREVQTRLGVAQETRAGIQAQWQELSDLLQKETNRL